MSIIDSSPKPKTVTLNNGASISTTKSRFGGGSLFLDGSNKYASIPDNTDFGFGTGDFTIEMWVYPLDNNNWRTLIAVGTHTSGLLWRIGTGGDQLYFNGNYWNWNASSVPLNSWSHLALVRNNGGIKVFINGTASLSTSDGNTSTNLGSSKAVNIGAYNPGSETFNGYIDEVRITKGIGTARYNIDFDVKTLLAPSVSSGTPITPPEIISNLSALARDQRADLSWTPPVEDNGGIITDYSFQYTTDDPTNNPTYYEYSHTASSASSGMISGLINGTTYAIRVAPINIAGTGSYVALTGIIPILPPVLSISQEPLNNRVTTSNESATFSISAELTNNTSNSSFSYQWQKYSIDFNDYNYKWTNISNATSSTVTLTSSNDFSHFMNPDSAGPIKCILTSPYETKNSKTVRLVNPEYYLNNFYFNINASQNDGGVSFGGNYYYGGYTGLNANQRTGISLYDNSYSNYDDSWFTGNDTKLKFQYSLNGSSWNDVDSAYSYNFRRKTYYNTSFETPPVDASGRVYFRFILEDLWPYTTNDGTSSTTESPYSAMYYYWIDYTATAPGEPSNVVADPGDGLAIVSWNAPTLTGGAPITSYTVQYALNGGSWTTFGTSTSTSLTVTGLNNGSGNNYTFRVAATNSAGTGSYSAASSSINTDASYATTPGVPTNITGIAGNTKVLLNWVAPSNIGKSVLTDYVVQLSTDDGATWENYVEPASSPTPTPTNTPTPTPTPLPMFYSPSASWSSVGFSGNGTLNDKYLGSSSSGLDSISIRVTSAGKLHITADNISSDDVLTITRNSTVLSLGDSNGYNANSFNFETMAVAYGQNNNVNAGDLITISDNYSYLTFTNLRVWWTPS
jgi:hypothetical protein